MYIGDIITMLNVRLSIIYTRLIIWTITYLFVSLIFLDWMLKLTSQPVYFYDFVWPNESNDDLR